MVSVVVWNVEVVVVVMVAVSSFLLFAFGLVGIRIEQTLLLSEPKGSMNHTKDCTTNNDIT